MNNGLYDPLFHCWINLGIGGDEGMEVTTLDGDAPGGYVTCRGSAEHIQNTITFNNRVYLAPRAMESAS